MSLGTILCLAGLNVLAGANLGAETTINSGHRFAHGANIGWLDAAANGTHGVVIGEYVCSGHLWGANVGWIHFGDGTLADGIRYGNGSVSDFGVNHDGLGNLRGYAYGANIGWVNFEESGAPKVDLLTGRLQGFVYSANCGWISLSNAWAHVQTDFIQPGTDGDGDAITDAWELIHARTLAALSASGDADGDGVSDFEEHIADTNPLDADAYLRILSYSVRLGVLETNTLTWASTPTRLYRFGNRGPLDVGTPWVDAATLFAPDPGATTTRDLILAPIFSERYFRVEAVKPLRP